MLAITRSSCMKRLSRIAGQVRGIARMIEEGRYSIDIVTQVSAARAALASVSSEIIKVHVTNFISHPAIFGGQGRQHHQVTELVEALTGARH